MRGKIRVRRGGHAHSSRGALGCRALRPLVGCTGQRLPDGPDGAGLAGGARVAAVPGLPSRHPGARERRLAAVVGAPARSAFRAARAQAAHAFPLRAGNRPADLAPSTSGQPARPPGRHPVPADLRVPSRRPAHVPNQPHAGPAPPAEPHTPRLRPRIPSCFAGACATTLAAASRASRTTSDNYLYSGHLGDLLRVDFLEKVLSPLRALTRLDRLSCRPWRSNSTHG